MDLENLKIDPGNVGISDVDSSSVPFLIENQFTELRRIRDKVDEAVRKARLARETSEEAHGRNAGFGSQKDAIDSLQTAVYDLSDAQVAAAEAEKLSFEYQERLGACCRYLLWLGSCNVAVNRSTVRYLSEKLKGASDNELDDMARRELETVVRSLKQQEDLMEEQQALSESVRSQGTTIGILEGISASQTRILEKQVQHDAEQDELLRSHSAKEQEHDEYIEKAQEKDRLQDTELARQAEKDREHDRRLDTGDEKDRLQDTEIARQAQKDEEHDRRLDSGDLKDRIQDRELARQSEKDTEHDFRLDSLDRRIAELEEQNRLLEDKISRLESMLETARDRDPGLTGNIPSLENGLPGAEDAAGLTKKVSGGFSRGASIASAVVGALGLITAIIGFFF